MTYENTQNALLKIIDTLKPDIDSHQMAILSGLIGMIHADSSGGDRRLAQAILAIADYQAKIHNNRGFKYGLSLAGKALRTMPPIVELVNEVEQ